MKDDAIVAETDADRSFAFAGVTLTRAGLVRLIVEGTLGAVDSGVLPVDPAAAVSINVVLPARVVAGEAFVVSATARDRFGDASPLEGAATWTGEDARAELPSSSAFANGVLDAADLVLRRAGATTLTIAAGGARGTAETEVVPGAAAALEVGLPMSVKSGVAGPVTISAVDDSGNVATDFAGTVTLAVDDAHSDLPASVSIRAVASSSPGPQAAHGRYA